MKRLRRRGRKRWLYGLAAVVLLAGYGYWANARSLPPLSPAAGAGQLTIAPTGSKLVWPTTGQAAVGITGSPIIDTHGEPTPAATASTAKLITALTVLQAKPLAPGQAGPIITLSASDVAIYRSYVAQSGSVVTVTAGEQINEYQMLEAMLLPSANNMADSLAIWAFGSLPAYTAAANAYLADHGLTHTRVGTDASGFAPSTTSTAGDLVKLGELAIQNPVLKQIVGQTTAGGIPVVGNIKNVNSLLGTDNIIGIKTGNNNQDSGVFISASRVTVNGQPVTIVTAVMQAPGLWQAMHDSLPLIRSAQANFSPVTVARVGQVIGRYRLPWGGSVPAVASRGLTVQAWNGQTLNATIKLRPVPANSPASATAGSLAIPKSALTNQQSIPINLQTSPAQPSLSWRLLHPF